MNRICCPDISIKIIYGGNSCGPCGPCVPLTPSVPLNPIRPCGPGTVFPGPVHSCPVAPVNPLSP